MKDKNGGGDWGEFSFRIDDMFIGEKSSDNISLIKQPSPIIVSPLNYMGGKKKLLSRLLDVFPNDVDTFVDLFCGGATVGVNSSCRNVLFNDAMKPIMDMYKYMYSNSVDECISYIDGVISEWGLTSEACGRDAYVEFRDECYNALPYDRRHPLDIMVLMSHSFNNQIRFSVNRDWKFNIPFGERCFNEKMRENLIGFINGLKAKNCIFTSLDFEDVEIEDGAFVYADPPYLISHATYNDYWWGEEKERALLNKLDGLNERGIRFALSNVFENKGKVNETVKSWVEERGYNVIHFENSYSNSYYNRKEEKSKTDEVLITNYDPVTWKKK